MKSAVRRLLLSAAMLIGLSIPPRAAADWVTALSDDFSAPSGWTYAGVSNATHQPLIRYDAGNHRVAAEWDQANAYSFAGDPQSIQPSRFSKSLGMTLTDTNTFRVRSVLRVSAVADTTEFHQIANFGLYGLANMGPDRTMSDNWSGNTTLVKDGSDFVEFNYFVNNRSFGFNPNVSATMGAHIAGTDGEYVTGTSADAYWHSTDLGADTWLPTNTDLYCEVAYFGGEADGTARRARSAIYTDATFTTLLAINGVSIYYWTQPLAVDKTFAVTDVAFYNYAGANWGGANATGSGSHDNLVVQTSQIPEPGSAALALSGLAALLVAGGRRRRMVEG